MEFSFQVRRMYAFEDLIEFCDVKLYRNVTLNKANAVEIYKHAKRHRLVKTQIKLEADFSN